MEAPFKIESDLIFAGAYHMQVACIFFVQYFCAGTYHIRVVLMHRLIGTLYVVQFLPATASWLVEILA
jgi:hypothetical protein